MEIIPEPEWDELVTKIQTPGSVTMLIGETDSGKSSLAKYLVRRLVMQRKAVCYVDADVGQSSLGLPGTISLNTFRNEADIARFVFERMSFVGTINPATNIAGITATVKRMVDAARSSVDIVLIDTSGLVHGEAGERLKISKLRAVAPAHLVAIQKGSELEPILRQCPEMRVHRLSVSRHIAPRPVARRVQYRRNKYRDYFRTAPLHACVLSPREAPFVYRNVAFAMRRSAFRSGTVIGLDAHDRTIALGILEDASDDSITFASPLPSTKGVRTVVFSDIVFDDERGNNFERSA